MERQGDAHDSDYAMMAEFADTVIDDVKVCFAWPQSTSRGDFGAFGKKMTTKRTSVDLLPFTKAGTEIADGLTIQAVRDR